MALAGLLPVCENCGPLVKSDSRNDRMSKAIRVMLIVVAVMCVPALIYPELGATNSPVSPLAVLFICGLGAVVWPSSKQNRPNREP